jgi:protein-S-isoprenylcysteine O-methyltransferase Ste14
MRDRSDMGNESYIGGSNMGAIVFQVVGVLVFVIATFVCGRLIRRNPNLDYAQRPIRIVHFCYWFFLVLPAGVAAAYPGLTRLDAVLGLRSLPGEVLVSVLGGLLFLVGWYYMSASSMLLARMGKGAMAFKFPKLVVSNGVYDHVRNPMALGSYLSLLGAGLMTHSTFFFFFNLLVWVPSHIYYVRYFEEFEVELRLGGTYIEYKQRTPFLIPKLSGSA